MSKNKGTQNIFTSAIPLYFYLKTLGLFPISFVGAFCNGNLSAKVIDKIYFLIMIIFWTLVWVYNILEPMPSEEYFSGSLVLVRAWYFTTNCGVLAIIVSMIYQYLKMGDTLDIFKKILFFDEKVRVNFSSFNNFHT
jgi:hypothetical protein